MQCLSPIHLKRSKPSPKGDFVTVPCGKCYACLSRKRSEWAFRLQKEERYSSSAYFFTLTYEDSNLDFNEDGYPCVSKNDIQLFMKRLRKIYAPEKIRYFIVSEYGPETYRPHYHGLIFNAPAPTVDRFYRDLQSAWRYGFVEAGSVTPASINYCAKYCISKHRIKPGYTPCFNLMSRRPGIGSTYVERHSELYKSKLQDWSVFPGGQRVRLPRYFRQKIFSDEETRILNVRLQAKQKADRAELEAYLESIGVSYSKYELDTIRDYNRRMEKQLTKKSKHAL